MKPIPGTLQEGGAAFQSTHWTLVLRARQSDPTETAREGGSYRVVVSLTRSVLWLLSLGIFDKAYAKATADSTDEHTYIAPDLFTAETSLGTYQGMTDQIVLSRTPGAFRTVMAPRGSSKPEWLPLRK